MVRDNTPTQREWRLLSIAIIRTSPFLIIHSFLFIFLFKVCMETMQKLIWQWKALTTKTLVKCKRDRGKENWHLNTYKVGLGHVKHVRLLIFRLTQVVEMLIQLAHQEEVANFTVWETDKSLSWLLWSVPQSQWMGKEEVFLLEIGSVSLQPNLHGITKIHKTILNPTCQHPPSKSPPFSYTDQFSQWRCWQCRSKIDTSWRGRTATFQKACSHASEPKKPTLWLQQQLNQEWDAI